MEHSLEHSLVIRAIENIYSKNNKKIAVKHKFDKATFSSLSPLLFYIVQYCQSCNHMNIS